MEKPRLLNLVLPSHGTEEDCVSPRAFLILVPTVVKEFNKEHLI